MTVNLYDVEGRELVLVFYNSEVIDILSGAEKWEKGRVLELLFAVSDGASYDQLDLAGLCSLRAAGLSRMDLEEERKRLDFDWGVGAMAYPDYLSIDWSLAGSLWRYAPGCDC